MLKGQEKQQQVIKNSKKCFVFFFSFTYMMFCFCCSGLRFDFYCEVDIYSTCLLLFCFLIYIYQIKKKGTFVVLYLCSRGLFFTYLDNNIGINRKITRNCLFCYVYCLFVVVCLLSFVCHLKSKELCSVG
jgi:hypothetical protein